MPAKPDRQGQIEPPVIDRRAWIFGILETHKYSKTTLEVAGATGWKFFNRLTGETKVKAQTIAIISEWRWGLSTTPFGFSKKTVGSNRPQGPQPVEQRAID